jgi:multidrug transporter EmrE-like cation transporter
VAVCAEASTTEEPDAENCTSGSVPGAAGDRRPYGGGFSLAALSDFTEVAGESQRQHPLPHLARQGQRGDGRLLRRAAARYRWPPVPAAFWGWVGALVPLEALAMLLYMRAIRDSPLYLTLPYLAFTPVVTTVMGLLLLGEQPSPKGLSGILLVVAGAYLLNSEHAESVKRPAWRAPLQAAWRDTGSRLMLAVAAIYDLTSVMGKARPALRPAPDLRALLLRPVGRTHRHRAGRSPPVFPPRAVATGSSGAAPPPRSTSPARARAGDGPIRLSGHAAGAVRRGQAEGAQQREREPVHECDATRLLKACE